MQVWGNAVGMSTSEDLRAQVGRAQVRRAQVRRVLVGR